MSVAQWGPEWIPAFVGMTRSLRRSVAVVGVALDSIYITDRTCMNDAAIIATVRQYFSRRARNVVTAYVFGSVGKGLSGLSSDVAIAVLTRSRQLRPSRDPHLACKPNWKRCWAGPLTLSF